MQALIKKPTWLTTVLCALIAACSVGEQTPPKPLSVQPASATSLERIPIEILGQDFLLQISQQMRSSESLVVDAGFQVNLRSAQQEISLEEVLWVSTHELRATVPAKIPNTTYDLVITSPAGQTGQLDNAFCVDEDGDALCDLLDLCVDADGDGFGIANHEADCPTPGIDVDDQDPNRCADQDADGCEDCSSGAFDPNQDGLDFDGDGLCDSGDPDDDNDGVLDDLDTDPQDPFVCQDLDHDACDDCSSGRDGLGPQVDAMPDNDGTDRDGDGFCDLSDCDDTSALCFPGNPAADICDGLNQDCDAEIDEDPDLVWYQDSDGDGFGDVNVSLSACLAPLGYVADSSDCDDVGSCQAGCFPGNPAADICDGLNQDCDAEIDEDPDLVWYQDSDGDGFGDVNVSLSACLAPIGYVDNSLDCEDDESACGGACSPVLSEGPPGALNCTDGYDNDCDGVADYVDSDCGGLDLCSALVWATASAGLIEFSPATALIDPPPLGQTPASGDWGGAASAAQIGGFSLPVGLDQIRAVDVALLCFVDAPLVNDFVRAQVYFDGVAQGAAVDFLAAQLNLGGGLNGFGYEFLDVNAAREWQASDFSAGLSLDVQNIATGQNDGANIYFDLAGFRVWYACNTPPEAKLKIYPVVGLAPLSVAVDASESVDAEDGANILARWDWDGDGVWDTERSPILSSSHIYSVPGRYVLTVEISDQRAAIATASEIVVVGSAGPLVVNTDVDEDINPGSGLSLREAIDLANVNPDLDQIVFQGPMTIWLGKKLPDIQEDLEIISSFEVILDGSLSSDDKSFTVKTAHSLFVGMRFQNFARDGVLVDFGELLSTVFTGCQFYDNGEYGLHIKDGALGLKVGPNNAFVGNGLAGIYLDSNNADFFNIVGNQIHDNLGDGIRVRDAEFGFIVQNQIYRNSESGIQLDGSADSNRIWHNSVVANWTEGLLILNNPKNLDVRYNIFAMSQIGYGLSSGAASFLMLDANLYDQNAAGVCLGCVGQSNALLIDPLFVDVEANDFRLQDASPAIDAAQDLSLDLNGPAFGLFNGAAPDIGSIESRCGRFYQDADADGYGDSALFLDLCGQPYGYVIDGSDCDDSDPLRHANCS